jgi:hypothetical protein
MEALGELGEHHHLVRCCRDVAGQGRVIIKSYGNIIFTQLLPTSAVCKSGQVNVDIASVYLAIHFHLHTGQPNHDSCSYVLKSYVAAYLSSNVRLSNLIATVRLQRW